MCFYLGIPVVLLAMLGARRERFWLGVIGASLLLMLGTPAWNLLRMVPGMGFFRFPVRFSLCLSLAVAVLASRGLDELIRMEANRLKLWARRFTILGGVALVGLSLLGLGLALGEGMVRNKLEAHFLAQVEPPAPPEDLDPLQKAALPDPEPEDPEGIPLKIDRILDSLAQSTRPWSRQVLLPLGLLIVMVLLIRGREKLGRRRMALGLLGLVYLDLWLFGSSYLQRVAPADSGLESVKLEALGEDPGAWRSTVVDRRQDPSLDGPLMSASLGLLHGTRDVIVTSPLMILRNEALLAELGLDVGDKGAVKLERLAAHPELVDLLGLRWLLSVHDLGPLGYARIDSSDTEVGVYENPDPLPTGFLVSCARQVTEPFEALLELDPRQAAIVESPTSLPDCADGARAGRVQFVERSPTELLFSTESEQATLLVDNQTWYPGWEAQVNGEPSELLRTDLLFRGVELPAGDHEVRLSYRPTWAGRAWWLSSVGFLGMLGWGLWGWKRRRTP
jgi:hypothetical protein